MIRVYYRSGCQSSIKVCSWFEENGIEIKKNNIRYISRQELILLLSMTNTGMEEIIKHKGNNQRNAEKWLTTEIKFNEALNFLKCHTEILRTPIILDNNKYMLGFNNEEIRKFIPAKRRKEMYFQIQKYEKNTEI